LRRHYHTVDHPVTMPSYPFGVNRVINVLIFGSCQTALPWRAQTQAIHFCTTKLFNAVETVHCQINDYRAGKHRDTKLSDSKKMDIMKKLNVSNSNLWPSDYKSNWNLEMLVFWEGKPEKTLRPTQSSPTCDAKLGIRSQTTLVVRSSLRMCHRC